MFRFKCFWITNSIEKPTLAQRNTHKSIICVTLRIIWIDLFAWLFEKTYENTWSPRITFSLSASLSPWPSLFNKGLAKILFYFLSRVLFFLKKRKKKILTIKLLVSYPSKYIYWIDLENDKWVFKRILIETESIYTDL
jgi:hypothetical protein